MERGPPKEFVSTSPIGSCSPPLCNDKSLKKKKTKAKRSSSSSTPLQKTCLIVSEPSVLHLGGYRVGKEENLTIRIRNSSREKVRISTIGLRNSKEFQLQNFQGKRTGILPPGLCEPIKLSFKALEWKYMHDILSVKWYKDPQSVNANDELESQDLQGEIEIPLHAYPVVNKAKFPRMIDFGVCEPGKTHTCYAVLECSVPIPFDFEITEIASRKEFNVEPKKGQVPANGFVKIKIQFTPTHLTVASTSFRLMVAQFNFEPIVCTVTGSASSGITRESRLAEVEKTFYEELGEDTRVSTSVRDAIRSVKFDSYAKPINRKLRGIGSGAVIDPGAVVLEEAKRNNQEVESKHREEDGGQAKTPKSKKDRIKLLRKDESAARKGQNQQEEEEEEEEEREEVEAEGQEESEDEVVIDGIKVPRKIDGVQATNYILTQEPGKLKPKDLKKAINKHRAKRENEKREKLEAEKKLESAGLLHQADPADAIIAHDTAMSDQNTTRQVKEMIFLQHISEIEQEEKAREFQSQSVCIGSVPLSQDQIAFIQASRHQRETELAKSKRREQRQAWTNDLLGPHSKPPVRVFDILKPPSLDTAGTSDPGEQGEESWATPTFDPFLNNLWKRRKQVASHFVRVVGKVIVRKRAQRRIAAIWERLGSARSRAAVREVVEEDHIRSKLFSTATSSASSGEESLQEPEWKKYQARLISIAKQTAKSQSTDILTASKLTKDPQENALQDQQGDPQTEDGEEQRQTSESVEEKETQQARENERSSLFLVSAPEKISRSEILKTTLQSVTDLHLVSFPLYNDSAVLETKQVASASIKGFQDSGFFPLRIANESKLCGYSKFSVPAIPAFVPFFDDMPLRTGAQEESSWGKSKPRLMNEKELDINLPEEWLENSFAPRLELLVPTRAFRVYFDTDFFTEVDPEFHLQPKVMEYRAPETRDAEWASQIGASVARMVAKEPSISDWWRQNVSPYSTEYQSLWDCESLLCNWKDGPSSDDILSEDDASDIEVRATKARQGEEGGKETPFENPFCIEKAAQMFEEQEQGQGEDMSRFQPESPMEADHKQALAAQVRRSRSEHLSWLYSRIETCNKAIQNPALRYNLVIFSDS